MTAAPPAVAMQSQSNPFSALVGEKRERRAEREATGVDRYVLASDNRAFLLETRTRTARIKFLCGPDDPRIDCVLDPQTPAPEIYLVTVTRGPRGDSIFKTPDGDTVLRIASYGGATVHWPGDGRGLGASKSFGDDHTIKLPQADAETVSRRARAATALISARTGTPIIFETPMRGDDVKVLADAVARTAKAVDKVAGDPTGARILGERIDQVAFREGETAGVRFEGRALVIDYVPDQDVAGRPASRAIERFLEDTL